MSHIIESLLDLIQINYLYNDYFEAVCARVPFRGFALLAQTGQVSRFLSALPKVILNYSRLFEANCGSTYSKEPYIGYIK